MRRSLSSSSVIGLALRPHVRRSLCPCGVATHLALRAERFLPSPCAACVSAGARRALNGTEDAIVGRSVTSSWRLELGQRKE